MPRKHSDYFEIDKNILAQFDVLDGYVDIDSHFYIDPSLLDSLKIPEFTNAKKIFDEKFIEIKELLARSKMPNCEDIEFAKACKLLKLNEKNEIKLGYSHGNYGRGIGEKLALNICKNLFEIIKHNPANNANLLDYIYVFQKGFGADFVSDMTANIINNCFIDYTNNIINKIALDKKYIKILSDGRSILNKDDGIYFLPKKILTALPIVNQFFNVSDLIDHNENLRRRIDKIVIDAISEKTSKSQKKGTIKGLLINNLNDILAIYDFFKKDSYDFDLDPMNLLIWQKIADKYNLDQIKQKIKEKDLTISDLVLLIINSISISDVSSFYSQYKGRMRRNHLTYIYLSIMERALEGLAIIKPNGASPFIVEKDDKKIGIIVIDSSYAISNNKIKKIDDIQKFINDNNLINVFLVFIKRSDIEKDVIISNYIRKNKYNKINLIVINQYKS